MDLAPPAIDFVSLARSLGVSAARADGVGAIVGEIESAFASGAPALVEIPVSGSPERRAPDAVAGELPVQA
jgi:benzoylformate decarboxylase